jgi:hypothetical protein
VWIKKAVIEASSSRHQSLRTDQQIAASSQMVCMSKTLSTRPLIDPTASVRDSRLGIYTEVGARTKLLEVEMGCT